MIINGDGKLQLTTTSKSETIDLLCQMFRVRNVSEVESEDEGENDSDSEIITEIMMLYVNGIIENVVLTTLGGNNIFNIYGTMAPTTIEGGEGDDIYNFGPPTDDLTIPIRAITSSYILTSIHDGEDGNWTEVTNVNLPYAVRLSKGNSHMITVVDTEGNNIYNYWTLPQSHGSGDDGSSTDVTENAWCTVLIPWWCETASGERFYGVLTYRNSWKYFMSLYTYLVNNSDRLVYAGRYMDREMYKALMKFAKRMLRYYGRFKPLDLCFYKDAQNNGYSQWLTDNSQLDQMLGNTHPKINTEGMTIWISSVVYLYSDLLNFTYEWCYVEPENEIMGSPFWKADNGFADFVKEKAYAKIIKEQKRQKMSMQ